MARSTQEIYNSFLNIKSTQSELDGLTSTSQTALWRNFLFVVAAGISVFEQIWDAFREELIYIKDTTPVYTATWWKDRMINQFQYDPGSPATGVLQLSNFIPGYAVEDESLKIIDYCSVTQQANNRLVTIKVAKDDGNGNPEVLDVNELSAAQGYVNAVQAAGLYIRTVSFTADELFVDLDIYYDSQYVEGVVRDNVVQAIKDYLANLEFDGRLRVISLIDYIQETEGVVDVYFNSLEGQKQGENGVERFDRIYTSKAGFINFDEDNSIINLINAQ